MTDADIEKQLKQIFTKWKNARNPPFISTNTLIVVRDDLIAQGVPFQNAGDQAKLMLDRMVAIGKMPPQPAPYQPWDFI